jgi:hypothetical protein
MNHRKIFVTSLLALAGTIGVASAQVVPALLVVKEGDTVGASTVTDLGDPFTNSLGQVGFVLTLADATRGVWAGTGQIFNSSQDATILGAFENTMGISDALDFLISPSLVGGLDAVYASTGVVLKETDEAPGFPGRFSAFNSRSRMVANGTAFWVGGTATTVGGASSQRVFYSNPTPAIPSATVPLITGGQAFGAETITQAGIEFGYDVSDDATRFINRLIMSGSTATDAFVAVGGTTIVAREGSVADGVELWQGFGFVGINDSGQWVVSGDTNGPTATDGIVVSPAGVIFREGQAVGGQAYAGVIDAISINNVGGVAMVMDVSGGTEALVIGPVASFVADADLLLKTNDQIDVNGDNVADFVVTDFNASVTIAPGLDIADDGAVYVNVDISDLGGLALGEAIIAVGELPTGPTCDSIDFNNDGSSFDPQDIDAFLSVFSEGPCIPESATCNDIDFNNDGSLFDPCDIDAFLLLFSEGPCTLCGE